MAAVPCTVKSDDGKKCVMLVLLDLSAAFDTIDYEILLLRLEIDIDVCGSALAWFRSYLSGRTQSVRIHNTTSQPQPLHYGVPQGSVLGPVLFTVYSAPIAATARQHGLSARPALCRRHSALSDFWHRWCSWLHLAHRGLLLCIRRWVADNKVKLNDEKTIVLFLRAPSLGPQPNISGLTIGNTFTSCSASARNLGAIFDQHLSMEAHVRNVCSSAFYHLHHISRIRDVLDIKTAATVVQALVISRLDYCNSLLYGLPSTLINRLQRVQNTAARVVARAGGRERITPVLANFRLHWLPVQYRITFKILLLTYRALHGLAPSYLTALLAPYRPSRALRSGQQHLLRVPQTRLLTFWDRSFAFAAPKLWNSLPCKIREAASLGAFKKALKTRLFGLAYSQLLGISDT